MKIDAAPFKVREGDEIDLGGWATQIKPLCKSKKASRKLLQDHVEQLSDGQRLLYASNRHALLLMFQAMDTAGKDAAADDSVWHDRYRSIVDLERHLHANGTRIVKAFLHLSKDEQRRRLLARIDEPDKNRKFSAADIAERKLWDAYIHASLRPGFERDQHS